MLIAEVTNWPGAIAQSVPYIATVLLAVIAFYTARADRNAKLAATEVVAAKGEIREVKDTLKTSTASTATADANLDAKLDSTHGAVMGEIAVVREQTNGQLTEMRAEATELKNEVKELLLALEKSHKETADAKGAKDGDPQSPEK
jgi:hypothetical protein